MQWMKYACLAVALATTWLAPPAKAAEIATSENRSILITGRIQSGDETSFQSLLSSRSGRGPTEVHLNSAGGLIQAAMKIADMVREAVGSDHVGRGEDRFKSAFANCGGAVAHVQGSYGPILLKKSLTKPLRTPG